MYVRTFDQLEKLEPGMAYNVQPKDRYRVRVHTDMLLLSVNSQPLTGDKHHDEDGALATIV